MLPKKSETPNGNWKKNLIVEGDRTGKKFLLSVSTKTRSRTGVGPLAGTDGTLVTDEKEIAGTLN